MHKEKVLYELHELIQLLESGKIQIVTFQYEIQDDYGTKQDRVELVFTR